MVEPPGTRLSSVVASSQTARDAFVVDAVVLVEAVVLDRDGRPVLTCSGTSDAHRVAPGLAVDGHQPAVAGIDVHRLLQLDVAQVATSGRRDETMGSQRQ